MPQQIGCETCLKLQKSYSEMLRQYVDTMQRQVDFISQGDYARARECHAVVDQAHQLCADARRVLQTHEAEAHGKTIASGAR